MNYEAERDALLAIAASVEAGGADRERLRLAAYAFADRWAESDRDEQQVGWAVFGELYIWDDFPDKITPQSFAQRLRHAIADAEAELEHKDAA